ncbi:hypothetical protein ACLB2K_028986 [Fragaria x ananassa]
MKSGYESKGMLHRALKWSRSFSSTRHRSDPTVEPLVVTLQHSLCHSIIYVLIVLGSRDSTAATISWAHYIRQFFFSFNGEMFGTSKTREKSYQSYKDEIQECLSKSIVEQLQCHLIIQKKKSQAITRQGRDDIGQLLQIGQLDQARARIDSFCNCITSNISDIYKHKHSTLQDLPNDVGQAIASLIYAASVNCQSYNECVACSKRNMDRNLTLPALNYGMVIL